MFKIYPYNMASESVRRLKDALNAKLIKLEGSSYVRKAGHIVINWGNSRPHPRITGPVLNEPHAVSLATNKVESLNHLAASDVATVPFTTVRGEAQDWADNGDKVFARHVLNGHSGAGIEVVLPQMEEQQDRFTDDVEQILTDLSEEVETDEHTNLLSRLLTTLRSARPRGTRVNTAVVPVAPLYTKGVRNDGEYRVHVFQGDVILYQKKSRRVDEDGNVVTVEGENSDIRNLSTNWIYRTGSLRRIERVEQLAIRAIEALGLDFGAVDIIKNPDGDVFILEVNTAPGLGNEDTLNAYVEAFNNLTA